MEGVVTGEEPGHFQGAWSILVATAWDLQGPRPWMLDAGTGSRQVGREPGNRGQGFRATETVQASGVPRGQAPQGAGVPTRGGGRGQEVRPRRVLGSCWGGPSVLRTTTEAPQGPTGKRGHCPGAAGPTRTWETAGGGPIEESPAVRPLQTAGGWPPAQPHGGNRGNI